MTALEELKEAAANDAALRSEFKKLIEELMAENARLRVALEAVEQWWISEGMHKFDGAPYAIFATRKALDKNNG